ncbi:DUF4118 domain-containing protein [Sphingomonas sp. NSE70-1]|uniref:DUF4118 domain-containing protein n=1 Tax=Sphingomonas caseinilyticus TaxID=2908205 RepID=A0ABT0RY16_9SPHN|nr:DUF4118 domain-containing protein [Sphingomonas caseinilyticus]MCL6699851.1 DUF4118 domain-containing protein [Sphingomonas caseinilyticus]
MITTMRNLLEAPAVTGVKAVPWAVLAVALPTFIRAAIDGAVVGVAVTPYVPFVVLAALFLGWQWGALVAVVAAAVSDALFIGPPNQFLEGPSDWAAMSFFFVSSVLIVRLIREMRSALAKQLAARPSRGARKGIVFSLEEGEAFASWQGSGPPMKLGPQEEVCEMMQDFIAQVELGKLLNRYS